MSAMVGLEPIRNDGHEALFCQMKLSNSRQRLWWAALRARQIDNQADRPSNVRAIWQHRCIRQPPGKGEPLQKCGAVATGSFGRINPTDPGIKFVCKVSKKWL